MGETPKLTPEYRAYLRSPAWKALRQEVLTRAGYVCDLCGSPGRLDVHHWTYERFGHERLTDLSALCRPCHESVDTAMRQSRAVVRAAEAYYAAFLKHLEETLGAAGRDPDGDLTELGTAALDAWHDAHP